MPANNALERTVRQCGPRLAAARSSVAGRSTRSLAVIEQIVSSAISFLVPCGIIAVASIPLMLNVVPPNGVYGFRTRQTLANRELWFRANRFAGCGLFIAAGASAAFFAVHPEYSSGRSFIGLLVFVVPLVTALGASFAYVRRVGGGGER